MINFSIPGFYEHYNINKRLLEIKQEYPEWFYDNINIESIYGTFPFWVWDGGRIFNNFTHATEEQIIQVFSTFKNISIRFVCTNPVIEEENFYNHFINQCLKLYNDKKNGIIINNPKLENYLKNNYPEYYLISSTTKCLNEKNTIQELNNNNYKLICLDYNLNNNWHFLNNLSKEQINKCELLCNAICPPQCKNRKEHYFLNGQFMMSGGLNDIRNHCFLYPTTSNITRNYKTHISPQQIQKEYEPKGFSYFKLEGRSLSDLEVVINYAYYMIKERYKDYFMLLMLEPQFINMTQNFK